MQNVKRIAQIYWMPALVGLAALSVILLPLNLPALQPFHHDEALYATWALKIASGDDPWLSDTPIDKPPLFLYTIAGSMGALGLTESAARLPSLLAAAAIVMLTFWLGSRLYNRAAGVLAAWLVALSPFMLMFAPTAFTDPMLVALVLAGCVSAAHRRGGLAGLWVGLAIATKQQGVFFVPLVWGLLVISCKWPVAGRRGEREKERKGEGHSTFRFAIALFATLLALFLWDVWRAEPSFLSQSMSNYGGLASDISSFGERWWGFVHLLGFFTGSPLLNGILLVGGVVLLLYSVWQIFSPKTGVGAPGEFIIDWFLAAFVLAFLVLHALFSFQVWDRYLLGLVPLVALLLARVLLLPWRITKQKWAEKFKSHRPMAEVVYGSAVALLLIFAQARPIQDAVNGRYPLGSNSHALRGIEQITGYLQGQVGANSTLYHHWLGTHWRFYLWNYPYDLQFWLTPADLAAKARPGHLIAFPARRSQTNVRLALDAAGLHLREITRAYGSNGVPSIILYQIESTPN